MGDGVNVAARLEGINKTFGTTICISDSVVEAVEANIVARPIRRVQVKGRKREFLIYELLGIRASDDPELKAPDDAARLCDMTREALLYFERGELDQASRRYEDILRAFPDDPVARSMQAMCSAKAPA
jgi:adenylate cyclase